ncbi:MAG: hypothetical protein AMXMBFR55_16080 [Gemmatimonadota bacterium]
MQAQLRAAGHVRDRAGGWTQLLERRLVSGQWITRLHQMYADDVGTRLEEAHEARDARVTRVGHVGEEEWQVQPGGTIHGVLSCGLVTINMIMR